MYSDLWKNDSQGKQVRARGAAGREELTRGTPSDKAHGCSSLAPAYSHPAPLQRLPGSQSRNWYFLLAGQRGTSSPGGSGSLHSRQSGPEWATGAEVHDDTKSHARAFRGISSPPEGEQVPATYLVGQVAAHLVSDLLLDGFHSPKNFLLCKLAVVGNVGGTRVTSSGELGIWQTERYF